MESHAEDPTTNSSQERIQSHEAAVEDLLDEAWFFGNLLHGFGNRKHMACCLPDLCPSSSDCSLPCERKMKPEKPSSSLEESFPTVEMDLDGRRRSSSKLLIQDHSPPPPPPPPPSSSYDDQSGHFHPPSSSEKTIEEVWAETDFRKKRSPSRGLLKAPSLPSGLGREDARIEEILQSKSHPRMSKSNRQSSLNISDLLPPRQVPKGIPNYRSRMSSEEDMRRRLLRRTGSIKSRGELECEELQGFKDLGFTFDKKDLSPRVVNILPGLKEKREDCALKEAESAAADDKVEEEEEEDQKPREPYLSDAWLSKSFKPRIPTWTPRGSTEEEDVKAHIKFWARAVASNAQLEC
ncbi:hypothetical protein SAY87_012156 [Trapa incisa]|uniref:Uncharacterized protein n=1 Tax=Trapa incisa TaxID=236973 RepID=A0AAN7GXH2_9MYRT|nr:hypothetical protein SAY87_012156 [Trapa incisa]